MKTLLITTLLGLALSFSPIFADEKKPAAGKQKHDHPGHHHPSKAGPHGGRLITAVEPHVEFIVNKEKKVEILFVGDDNKLVAPGEQQVTVILGQRSKPTKLTFARVGDKLVSDKPVPEGNDYPTVVQIRARAGARPVNENFNLNMSQCPTCAHPEFACACEHSHDHKGHDHKKDAGKDAKKGS